MSTPDRAKKLDRDHPGLSIRRQCGLLGLARSGVYRRRKAAGRRRTRADAPDRRAVPELSLSGRAADGRDAARGRA